MKFGFELSIGSGFRFYPDKKLGSGAFGEMFQGIRVKDQRPVALKIVIMNYLLINIKRNHH